MNKKTIKGIKATRSIHLIDIENLCGSGDLSVSQVEMVRAEYFELVQPGLEDLFIIASSHHNIEASGFGWPVGCHNFRSGADGADIVLAKAMLEDHIFERFDAVFLASGDGGLAPFASELIRQGSKVTVVTGPTQMSYAMRLLGCPVVYTTSTFELAA